LGGFPGDWERRRPHFFWLPAAAVHQQLRIRPSKEKRRFSIRPSHWPAGELLGPLEPGDPAKAAVTVRHLLTMSGGIGGDELANPDEYNNWAAAPNQLQYFWNLPLLARPVTRFSYFSPAYHVLSVILSQACGRSAADFARDNFFEPLGIEPRPWETDNQDYNNGSAGLRLTPLDMTAVGNLVLAEGRAGERQVVFADWIRGSTRRQMATDVQPYMSGYGFGWWTGQTAARRPTPNGRPFSTSSCATS
jgi:CubicO group peptidase (beta-lactamase class C family)